MTVSTATDRRSESPTESQHRFEVGQAVRVIGGFRSSHNVYFVTAKLPPMHGSPQYHVRDQAEGFERMVMEANLEPVPGADRQAETSK